MALESESLFLFVSDRIVYRRIVSGPLSPSLLVLVEQSQSCFSLCLLCELMCCILVSALHLVV